MYELLNRIDHKLGNRYKTIETNIKAKSNSFYESLLAMLEGLARLIASEQTIEIESEYDTLIGIIRVKGFENYCLNHGFSKDDYEKLFKLAKAVNEHKHDLEKQITLEAVIEYLRGAYEFAAMYYRAKFNVSPEPFNQEEIAQLYGQTEKEIESLIREKQKLEESLLKESNASSLLQSDLDRVKEIAKAKDREYSSLEEQRNAILNELNELKDIKLSSMDEKINEIIAALKKQTVLLGKVTETLEKTNEILETRNFSGKHWVHN